MRILDRILSRAPSAGPNRRDRGLTLIETSVVLGILAVVVVYLGTMLADSSERIRARAAADRLAEVHDASTAYIKANYSKLVAVAPNSPNALVVPVTGSAGPSGVPGGTSLQGGGFLPASFVNVNSYNQTHSLLVRKLGSNGLEALVTTNGGQVIPDAQLGRIASFRGAAGGFMASRPLSSADNGVVTGAYGGWRTAANTWGSASRPTVGHLASTLAFDDGGMIADYLYRNDIGIPEANRMNTSIDLNSNDLNNVRTLNASTGNIGQVNADNVVATLDIWARRDLLAGRNVVAGSEVHAPRIVAGAELHSKGAAQVDGNLGVSGAADVFGGIKTSTIRASSDVTTDGTIFSRGGLQSQGNVTTAGGLSFSTDLKASPGTRSTAGIDADLLVFNSQGNLSKGNGIRLRDLLPRTVAQYSYTVGDNGYVPKPTCVGGYGNSRIMLYRQTDSTTASAVWSASGTWMGGVNVTASRIDVADTVQAYDSGFGWTVRWSGHPQGSAPRRAVAQTFCYYDPQ